MEEGENFSLCGKAVVVEANLRNEYYWKLIADFIGPQSGEELELENASCKNRLLIQVGLLREDNNFPWSAIVDWLKHIFPRHQSADFRRLIERGIATTLSLGSEARLMFLESDVNFNFVGPICDSIGVERGHLMEMRDFSEQAQAVEVTNGLILELSNFIAREKLAPVVIVSWLRNFNPEFCKSGNIQKEYKVLKAKIKKLKLHYLNYETRSHRRNAAMENLLQSPFELVRKKTQRYLVKKRMRRDDTVNHEKVIIKEEYESFEIMQGEGSENRGVVRKVILKERVSLHKESDEDMSVSSAGEDDQSNQGDVLTLLDVAMLSIQKLSSVYGGKTTVFQKVSSELLHNQFALMCKEHPAMAELADQLHSVSEDTPLAFPVAFLNFNANFLVDVHNTVEQHILQFEKEITSSAGQKLGRDKLPKFKKFLNLPESATSRYIHMACEILCPRTPDKHNYRKHWIAFCDEKRNPSKLTVTHSNELYSYFEAAAGLIHHNKEIPLFFSDLLTLNNDRCPNVILESVAADANDSIIQSLVCVLAIIHCKILGPYWQLLKSGGEYLLFSRYVLCLYQRFLDWSKDPSTLLEPEEASDVFQQVPLQEQTFNGVFNYCGQWHTNRDLIRACLKRAVKVIAAVTEEHLKDFLPGGMFSKAPSPDLSSQFKHITFSALMAEYPFENTLFNDRDIPDEHASHKNMPSDSSQEEDDQSSSVNDSSDEMFYRQTKQKKHTKERTVREETEEDMDRNYIIDTVARNGGPCRTKQDVDKMMLRFDGKSRVEKRDAIRCEILYQKMILNNTDPHLDCVFRNSTEMVLKLKLALPRVKPGFSLVLAPKKTD